MPARCASAVKIQPMTDNAPLTQEPAPLTQEPAPLTQEPAPLAEIGLQREIAALFVQALNLDIDARDIDPQAPLYGDGLGLDSIDILEIALILSKQYGIQLRANSDDNRHIFGSLTQLARYVAAQRTK